MISLSIRWTIMADSLEEMLEKATNPSNIGDNNIEAQSFANQVNKEFDGPQRAVKLIAQKIALHQEPVTLQALNVLECCVKCCGQKFHQEIGKYRFLNELIKLLSPKYDGDITSQIVKDRMIELLYSWYVGLPSEVKIAEAYRMLKQQGVIRKDPASEGLANAPANRPRNTSLEDEEKSQLLATLLKSTNPDDLQAANRLIKTMVKQEEERLEKFSKRVQELETVSNNVKLLTEMLAAYHRSIPETEKETMKYLYESCLSMRTQLFRMASASAEEKDDTLSEILSLSDDLTRAIDEYKHVVIQGGSPKSPLSTAAQQQSSKGDHQSSNQLQGDSLLDLGLDFQPDSSTNSDNQPGVATTTSSSSSLLDEQFKLLGLDDDKIQVSGTHDQTQAVNKDQWGAFGSAPFPQQPIPHNAQQQMQFSGQYYPNNLLTQPGMTFTRPAQVMGPGINMPSAMTYNMRPVSSNAMTTGKINTTQTRTSKQPDVKRANDPLAFDVFSSFAKDEAAKPEITDDRPKETSNDIPVTSVGKQDKIKEESKGNNEELVHGISNKSSVVESLIDISAQPNENSLPIKSLESLSADGYSVPLEAIEPSHFSPIVAMDKDGVKTILNIVKDKRETANPNVIVAVLSTISTNVMAISEFKIEISVPKVMRIKLQPPSATNLPSFNPLLPPSAITQILLIANPAKETIRMQMRISYKADEEFKSEVVTIDNLPVT